MNWKKNGLIASAIVLPMINRKRGQRNIEDILYLAQSRGEQHQIKIARTFTVSESAKMAALEGIVIGEGALRGIPEQSLRDMATTVDQWEFLYFQFFGRNYFTRAPEFHLTTANGFWGGDDTLEEMKYRAQKMVFNSSIIDGIIYHVSFCPFDMSDPFLSDQWALEKHDAWLGLSSLFKNFQFFMDKYGNMDRFPGWLAYQNLANQGIFSLEDVAQHSFSFIVTEEEEEDILAWVYKKGKTIDVPTMKKLLAAENLWRQAWTVPARKHARMIANKRRRGKL